MARKTFDLTPELVALDSVTLDPENARKHATRSLSAIASSLTRFGQVKPVVVRGSGRGAVVIAGNGTVEAARSLGWDEISVVRVPKAWTPKQARAYALADNRTSELSEWDYETLRAQLADLEGDGIALDELGWELDEMDDMSAAAEESNSDNPPPGNGTRMTPSIGEYAERYANAATRVLMCDYDNDTYVWVIERLGRIRMDLDLLSNAAAVLVLVQQYFNENPPEQP